MTSLSSYKNHCRYEPLRLFRVDLGREKRDRDPISLETGKRKWGKLLIMRVAVFLM